jgi:hypothetical protein
MVGILICLILIALKPTPSFEMPYYNHDYPANESVVQLAENRIAIVDTSINSGRRGEIIVLEYDEELERFKEKGRHNYLDFFYSH